MRNLEEKLGNEWLSLSNRLLSPKIIEIDGIEISVSSIHGQLMAYEKLGWTKDAIRVRRSREASEKQRLG